MFKSSLQELSCILANSRALNLSNDLRKAFPSTPALAQPRRPAGNLWRPHQLSVPMKVRLKLTSAIHQRRKQTHATRHRPGRGNQHIFTRRGFYYNGTYWKINHHHLIRKTLKTTRHRECAQVQSACRAMDLEESLIFWAKRSNRGSTVEVEKPVRAN